MFDWVRREVPGHDRMGGGLVGIVIGVVVTCVGGAMVVRSHRTG